MRLLKEDYVGYAVQDGVDERPMIVNWKTGQIIPLCFPIADKSTVQPESITEECPLASRRIIPVSFVMSYFSIFSVFIVFFGIGILSRYGNLEELPDCHFVNKNAYLSYCLGI